MLYKLKEKWNFKYFVVAEIGIILIINTIIFAILYIIAGLDSLYQNACYFFIKGFWIPGFFLAVVDIVVSAVKLYIQEHDFTVIREMTDLMVIVMFAVLLVFWSPTNFSRFIRVLLDVPNMIMDNTETMTTDEFTVLTKDEIHHTRSGKHYTYHYYTLIDGKDYLISDGLEQENFNQMVDDYVEDEMNGREKILDNGYYEITYLPISRCILSVTFYQR